MSDLGKELTVVDMERDFFQEIKDFHISYSDKRILTNMTSSHYHNGYEFMLVLEGTRHIFYDKSMKELGAGDLLILCPFVPHYAETPAGAIFSRYLLNFSNSYFDDILTAEEKADLFSALHSGIIHLNADGYERVFNMFRELDKAICDRPHTVSKLKLFKMRIACFVQEVGYILKEYPDTAAEPRSGARLQLKNSIEYIHGNYRNNITLEDAASHAHMSKSNFCLVFKKETGSTFSEYLRVYRAAQAHKLLLETDKSISVIAAETGFSSTRHMERAFMKVYGRSPRAMRKKHSLYINE